MRVLYHIFTDDAFLMSGLNASLPVKHDFRASRQQRGTLGDNPVSTDFIGDMLHVCISTIIKLIGGEGDKCYLQSVPTYILYSS